MAWTESAPAGIAWGDWVEGGAKINVNNYNNYRILSRIGRGAENTVAVAVQLQVYGRTYGVTGATPLKAQVSVGSTSAYSSSAVYDCTGSFGAWSTAKTVYYTGKAAKGTKVYARCAWNSSAAAATAHTAPPYTSVYTVSYSGGAAGVTGATASQQKTWGTALTLRESGFAREGCAFVKWNTKADGSGTDYNAGASYTANAAATLYARWAPDSYTVSFDANGGSGSTAAQTKVWGTALTLSECGFSKTGHHFAAWNTRADGSGTSYAAGESYTDNAAAVLYARWEPDAYAVTYEGNGADGGETAAQTKTWGAPLVLRSNGFTRRGWRFVGWNTAADGAGDAYAAGAAYLADEPVTLCAQWQKANIPVWVGADGAVYRVEKACVNAQGAVYEAAVYLNDGGVVRRLE